MKRSDLGDPGLREPLVALTVNVLPDTENVPETAAPPQKPLNELPVNVKLYRLSCTYVPAKILVQTSPKVSRIVLKSELTVKRSDLGDPGLRTPLDVFIVNVLPETVNDPEIAPPPQKPLKLLPVNVMR